MTTMREPPDWGWRTRVAGCRVFWRDLGTGKAPFLALFVLGLGALVCPRITWKALHGDDDDDGMWQAACAAEGSTS